MDHVAPALDDTVLIGSVYKEGNDFSPVLLDEDLAAQFFADRSFVNAAGREGPGRVASALRFYTAVRRVGASDNEARQAYSVEVGLSSAMSAKPDRYVACREAGATHDEAISVCMGDYDGRNYALCRMAGASHAEALGGAALALRGSYAAGRARGMSDEELAEVAELAQQCEEFGTYAKVRTAGFSHSDAVDYVARGDGLPSFYTEMRAAGACHAEALEVTSLQGPFVPAGTPKGEEYSHEMTTALGGYRRARLEGKDHETAKAAGLATAAAWTAERQGKADELDAAIAEEQYRYLANFHAAHDAGMRESVAYATARLAGADHALARSQAAGAQRE
jgi:hypothetical protein